ncbi:hypothetical protein D3C78_1252990 [compost metagenome]
MIVLGDHVQQRNADILQLHQSATDTHGSLHQGVLLHQLADDLTVISTGQRNGFGAEVHHQAVGLDVIVVPQVVQQTDLVGDAARRTDHVDRPGDGIRRNQAVGVDHAIDIDPLTGNQLLEHDFRPVDRRGEAHQVLQRTVRMQGGVDGREHPGHAVADQAHFLDSGIRLDSANRIRDEVEYVVLDAQTAFRSGRRIPVHHVDVIAAPD